MTNNNAPTTGSPVSSEDSSLAQKMANSPNWPVQFVAKWQRDWRISAEVVDAGTFTIGADGVTLYGRRTNPMRAAIYVGLRMALRVLMLGVVIATLMTAIGVSWRTQHLWWLLALPTLVAPVAAMSSWVVNRVARRRVEPFFTARIPWNRISRIASDGKQVEFEASIPALGTLRGRFVPKRPGKAHKQALVAIRDGLLPGGAGGVSLAPLRPAWLDRLALWTGFALVVWGGVWLEVRLSDYAMTHWLPASGALAGIPDALTPAQLEARMPATCRSVPQGPSVVNRRDGTRLTWALSGDSTNWDVAVLRWRAGSSKVTLVDVLPSALGSIDFATGAAGGVVGITAVVPHASADTFRLLLQEGSVDALYLAWCAGLVGSVDVSKARLPDTPTVAVSREGDALRISSEGLSDEYMLLPVRWRPQPTPDLFDLCEVPQRDGVLGLVPATPIAAHLNDFFHDMDEQARVYVIPRKEAARAGELLARGGTVQRCMVPDSLVWGGMAVALAVTPADTLYRSRKPVRLCSLKSVHRHSGLGAGAPATRTFGDSMSERGHPWASEAEWASTRQK